MTVEHTLKRCMYKIRVAVPKTDKKKGTNLGRSASFVVSIQIKLGLRSLVQHQDQHNTGVNDEAGDGRIRRAQLPHHEERHRVEEEFDP